MKRQRTSTVAELRYLRSLLERAACGDEKAFAALHALTYRKLRKTAVLICAASCDVEDVLQDSYVKIWRAASTFDPSRASPISWMCAIVRNTALDAIRAKKTFFADLEDAMAVPAPSNDACELDYELAKKIILEASSGLPEDRQRLLSLAYFEGKSRHSLAKQFGVPIGTVKTWLRRAVERIRADCLVTAKAMSL